MTRARYLVVALRRDLVAITDAFEPADPTMSVTNDIEAVVEQLVAREIIRPPRVRLIYRDTEGDWDEAVIEPVYPHRFVRFAPLHARTLAGAITAASL
jgi:hypothetical protein